MNNQNPQLLFLIYAKPSWQIINERFEILKKEKSLSTLAFTGDHQ